MIHASVQKWADYLTQHNCPRVLTGPCNTTTISVHVHSLIDTHLVHHERDTRLKNNSEMATSLLLST